ncbi:MAG: PEP/pyruvate-binding domain-containing protein [Syntrophorhabdales bacterium]
MGTKHVFWFTELGQNDNGMVGKKCANLGELTKLRMPVPRGFAISVTAEDKFLEETGARGEIRELVRRVGDDELKDFNVQAEVSRNMQAIIEGKEIPPDLAAAIVSCYEDLCARSGCVVAVSVRSAGVKSHPGMYETYLNIRGTQQVLQMVRKVWASIFNHRTVSAAIQHGLRAEDSPSIGVGVVELVNARGAGVCFTVHPVTGDPHTAVIESNWGLGESVVSGVVNVDRHVIEGQRKDDGREKDANSAQRQWRLRGGGATRKAGGLCDHGRRSSGDSEAGYGPGSTLQPPPGHRMGHRRGQAVSGERAPPSGQGCGRCGGSGEDTRTKTQGAVRQNSEEGDLSVKGYFELAGETGLGDES